jgi:hypothetical protein
MKKRFFVSVIFCSLCCLLLNLSYIKAQSRKWRIVEELGQGYIMQFAQDGLGTILAGSTNIASLRSADDGETWEKYSTLSTGGGVQLDALNDSIIYTPNNGLWETRESGDNWRLLGLSGRTIWDIATAKTGELLAGTSAGLFFTTNHGQKWWTAIDGLPSNSITTVACQEGFYVGTKDGLFFTSSLPTPWRSCALSGKNVRTIQPGVISGLMYMGADSGFYVTRSGPDGFVKRLSTDSAVKCIFATEEYAVFNTARQVFLYSQLDDSLIEITPTLVESDEFQSVFLTRDNHILIGSSGTGRIYRSDIFTRQFLAVPTVIEVQSPNFYPNPASDYLYSRNLGMIESVEGYDAIGRLSLSVIRPGSEVDVRHLSPGPYRIQIRTSNGVRSTSVMISR